MPHRNRVDPFGRLIETPVTRADMRARPGESMRFAATVAAFADALRGGTHLGRWDWRTIADSARQQGGSDPWKLPAEFAGLVEDAARTIAGHEASTMPSPPLAR